jgi:hypothetical protein
MVDLGSLNLVGLRTGQCVAKKMHFKAQCATVSPLKQIKGYAKRADRKPCRVLTDEKCFARCVLTREVEVERNSGEGDARESAAEMAAQRSHAILEAANSPYPRFLDLLAAVGVFLKF